MCNAIMLCAALNFMQIVFKSDVTKHVTALHYFYH